MATQRNLDFQGFVSSQDPRTMPGYSGTTPPVQPPPLQTDTYNVGQEPQFDFTAMIKQLKQAQAFGYQQESNAQNQQFQRGTAPLPGDLANKQLSPSQIRSFRSGEVSAIEPTVGGARNLVAEAKQAITDFQETEEKNRTRAGELISFALENAGSAGIESLLKTQPDLFKKAGFDAKTVEGLLPGIKRKEALAISTGGTESDKDLRDLNDAQTRLMATRGRDGFIDPTAYLNERAKSRLSPSDFDSRLGHLLSAQEKQRLLGKTKDEELTVDQSKARGFAKTASQAEGSLSASGYTPGLLTFSIPNRLQSGERQQFENAARSFVNSVLRRESGATITDAEFLNKYKELIPAPGDSEETIKQKARLRATQVQSLNESGLLSSGSGGGGDYEAYLRAIGQ